MSEWVYSQTTLLKTLASDVCAVPKPTGISMDTETYADRSLGTTDQTPGSSDSQGTTRKMSCRDCIPTPGVSDTVEDLVTRHCDVTGLSDHRDNGKSTNQNVACDIEVRNNVSLMTLYR